MTASFPPYPERNKLSAPESERSFSDQVVSRRFDSFLLRLLFVLGIWGGLFAFRSMLLSREPDSPQNTLIGTWEATDGSGFRLEMTGFGRFRVCCGDSVRLSGTYKHEDYGTISTTITTKRMEHGEEVGEWEIPLWKFKPKVAGDDLTIFNLTRTDSAVGFQEAAGESVQFKRKH